MALPHEACSSVSVGAVCHYAVPIAQLWLDPLAHFGRSFALTTAASDGKRQLGTGKLWKNRKQAATASKAQWAGYQLKHGAAKPLFDLELEPGEAIKVALSVIHPFTVPVPLEPNAARALDQLVGSFGNVRERRAHELLPRSVAAIAHQPDPALRRLLLGASDVQGAQLGQVCHIELYREMLAACGSVDVDLPSYLLQGFPIVGPIARSNRWPPYDKPQKQLPVEAALDRAWELRTKIIKRVSAVPVTENLQKIWDATMEDVQECSCLGPFEHPDQV